MQLARVGRGGREELSWVGDGGSWISGGSFCVYLVLWRLNLGEVGLGWGALPIPHCVSRTQGLPSAHFLRHTRLLFSHTHPLAVMCTLTRSMHAHPCTR